MTSWLSLRDATYARIPANEIRQMEANSVGSWTEPGEPGPVSCYAHAGGSVSILNGLPAGAMRVAYTTAFAVSLSLLTMKGAVPLSTNDSCGPYVRV